MSRGNGERDALVAEARETSNQFREGWRGITEGNAAVQLDRLADLAEADGALLHSTEGEIQRLRSERDQWKANHDEMVQRNAVLRQRPDLPADRLPAIAKYEGEIQRLRHKIDLLEMELGRKFDAGLAAAAGQSIDPLSTLTAPQRDFVPPPALAASPASAKADLYEQAVALVIADSKPSTSYVQRRLSINYNTAVALMERMEKAGLVTAANHAGKRQLTEAALHNPSPKGWTAEHEREACARIAEAVGQFIPKDAALCTAWQSGKREGIKQIAAAIRARTSP